MPIGKAPEPHAGSIIFNLEREFIITVEESSSITILFCSNFVLNVLSKGSRSASNKSVSFLIYFDF